MAAFATLQRDNDATTFNLTTGSDTSAYTIISTYTATAAAELVGVSFGLGSLNGAAATLTVVLQHTTSADALIREYSYSFFKPLATSSTAGDEIPVGFLIRSGEKLKLRVKSSNGSDTPITRDVTWYDAAGVSAVNDKAGYSLAASQTFNLTGNITGNLSGSVGSVSGAVGSVTGNVGGSVSGSVGSISGVTFPTNFATLAINASGHISRVTLVDTTTTNTDVTALPAALLATTNGSDTVGTQLGRLDATVGSRLAPTTAGRTLDVSDTGEAGIDLSNIKQATGATTLTNIALGTDAIVAGAVSAGAVEKIQEGLATSAANPGTGDGDVPVNHDTGGTDALAYKRNGTGVDNATIRAYTTADYSAGTLTLRARTTTDSNGRWVAPLYLNDGVSYTIVFEKPGVYGPDTATVTP
jgi:hypothetical protein